MTFATARSLTHAMTVLAMAAGLGCKGAGDATPDSSMTIGPAPIPSFDSAGFEAAFRRESSPTFDDASTHAAPTIAIGRTATIRPWRRGAMAMSEALPAPGTPVYLQVPLIQQQRRNWCWAASGSMVLDFLGKPVSQCQQANERFRNDPEFPKDCCPAGRCDWPAYPTFAGGAFTFREGDALSWDELTAQLRHGIPVAFSWKWNGGGEHMLVAIGFTTSGNKRWVYVNDPAMQFRQPPFIPYERFVRSPYYDHGRDYFVANIGS